jgi:CSLREA domain-containing protein
MDCRLFGLGALLAALASPPARAVVYQVNSTGDAHDANTSDGVCETVVPGVCTLRAAIEQANVTGGLIQVPAMTITLTSAIDIAHDMDIAGAGEHATVISGNGLYGIFGMTSAVTVSISDMTLRDGHQDYGAALLVEQANLTIDRCMFNNNYAAISGGAIFADALASLTIRNCIFTDNHAPGSLGGAIAVYGATAISMVDTAVHANTADAGAGLAFAYGSATLTNCTISGNTAQVDGGGMSLAPNGLEGSSVQLYSTTVAGNRASTGSGGGILSGQYSVVSIQNTILANNTRVSKGSVVSNDCGGAGTVSSLGNSIVAGICSVSGTYSTADPLLGPLQDNGGSSGPTHALVSGSPARDAGTVGGCPLTDQRGVHRDSGGACDIGAYEHAPCGDANGDGVVNVSDIFLLINYLFAGGSVPPGLANVNGDASLNVSDVFALIDALFAGGSLSCAGT